MIRLFEGDQHADLYKKYRRSTPKFVTHKAVGYLEEKLPRPHGVAVDVGCGSGQNTLCFAPYFEKIYGYDVSPSQVEEARKTANLSGNVEFAVSPAESIPLEDDSVEFVTGGFSFHWFDFDKFYAEVDRILVPGGVVAAIAHNKQQAVHPTKTAELNVLMDDYVATNLQQRLHKRNDYAFSDYVDLPLPYQEQLRLRGMPLDVPLTVADLVGAYASWSSFQMEYKEDPQKTLAALERFQAEFLKTMEVSTTSEETPIVVRYNYCLAMCRKPS